MCLERANNDGIGSFCVGDVDSDLLAISHTRKIASYEVMESIHMASYVTGHDGVEECHVSEATTSIYNNSG